MIWHALCIMPYARSIVGDQGNARLKYSNPDFFMEEFARLEHANNERRAREKAAKREEKQAKKQRDGSTKDPSSKGLLAWHMLLA